MALEGGSATPTAKAYFYLKKKNCLALGVVEPPQGPPFGSGVALATPYQLAWGGFGHPNGQTMAFGGGLATPRAILKNQKKKREVLFYFKY
jgi:hypothetical protein